MSITPLTSGPFLHSHHSDSRQPAPLATGSRGAPQVAETSQKALRLFEQTLAAAYEKLGLRVDKANGSTGSQSPLTAEKVAENILGFIERRLQMDIAEGATPEQLQTRLDAGLSGFKKGFAEASEKLTALSMLSPAIAQDIGKTYTLVTEGIDRLQQQLVSLVNPPAVAPSRPVELAEQASSLLQNSNYQYAKASSFSFELMTAEGDRVTISVNSNRAYSANYTSGSAENSRVDANLAAYDSSSWSIAGDLNENELEAINKLLQQVDKLAVAFFDGDLDLAFNQAVALGYDTKQITAFSLQLTQVEVQRVSATYQTFDNVPSTGLNLAERLLPVGQFIKHLLESVEELKDFAHPKELLLDVAGRVPEKNQQDTDQPGERLANFIARILDGMDN
jgi:hypothetical protein